MIPAISSAASGIRHGLAVLDRAAHNIANENTESFQRSEVIAQEAPGGGVESLTVPAEGGGLVDDLVATLVARHTVSLNAGLLRRADSALGSLIDVLA